MRESSTTVGRWLRLVCSVDAAWTTVVVAFWIFLTLEGLDVPWFLIAWVAVLPLLTVAAAAALRHSVLARSFLAGQAIGALAGFAFALAYYLRYAIFGDLYEYGGEMGWEWVLLISLFLFPLLGGTAGSVAGVIFWSAAAISPRRRTQQ